ncbi:MAG: MCE family protein, partial [Solirubrobacterales bacterium]|nr:MCE family protein [Solirubrobacterales bacterium]MBV9715078.1 MCE family protein [Solirubrobacterales bacterium]
MIRRNRRRAGPSPFAAGVIGIVVVALVTYLGFTKFRLPFVAHGNTVRATFMNANQLRPGSLVRIAGVNVGTVTGVSSEPGCHPGDPSSCQAALVTMQISDDGMPLHKDATFAIRPRTFLEGNFFVDIRPGSPSAPVAPSSYVFPAQQGTAPVQLDQVLTSLQSDTRRNLQILLQQYGSAVKQGGPAYNASIQYWLPAYKYTSLVAHDALGIDPNDLSNWVAAQGTVAGALDAHPQNLESLITDFNTTATAFARESTALQQAVAELPRTLAAATPTLTALNADFCAGPAVPNCAPGPVPTLASALVPGVRSTGPMVDATLPFISQLRQLVRPQELQGLTSDLSATVPSLARLVEETIPFLSTGVRPATSCVANVIIPWSHLTLHDPHFNAGNGFPPRPVYVEAVNFLPGLAGESRNFDPNGPYIRVLGALGQTEVTSLQSGLVGGALTPLIGVQPQLPPGGHPPPLEPGVPCETQAAITDLSAASGAAPAPVTGTTMPASIGLVPLAFDGSADRNSTRAAGRSQPVSASAPAAARTNAGALQSLVRHGLFEIVKPSSATGLPPRGAAAGLLPGGAAAGDPPRGA